ncbi:acyl-CoA synthetase [Nocardioides sp. cx-173]|uniref:acyl-CoA synthetase n=1 Tax=Nocardioides sp. cx-173 TaxID=2898796 RepID=UPI001E4AB3AB|nr:acyl-CoA synthetase [Nocardioides sp. cx-173]MCD4526264.1 acyl-CoA synthetase [Nocardioides sp. cx-173]UGB40527.1 acyl-CoA synthetase [Nocardioides sp. cx-173]
MPGFNLSTVFRSVARAVPDQEVLVWRDRRLTYAEADARMDGVAHFLVSQGLGCHTERDALAGHESGQSHLGVYLRNGNEYLETLVGAWRARVAPYNINYRYVEEELRYLLQDAGTDALVYAAEFAPQVAALRDRVAGLRLLVQVADDSGHALLPGAVDYADVIGTPAPAGAMPEPSGDDLFIMYTGGTTGMPKGVVWRHDDVFISAMGGLPFGTTTPYASYEEIAQAAVDANGGTTMLMLPPFMHGAAQWSAFHMFTTGGKIVIPDDVHRMDPADALSVASRERCLAIPVVGDAVARPLVEELEHRDYDLSGVAAFSNGGAPLSPTVRSRLLEALPHIMIRDTVGSSETGIQLNVYSFKGAEADAAVFEAQEDTAVLSGDLTRLLGPGERGGWLARTGRIPLGYLGDAEKTARTFPVVDGVRWSVPGDRANVLEDGRIELLGRDGVTVNSGGEKIFVEEVERALAAHPAVRDVVVVGRPSERWGSEVVGIVQLADGADVTDEDLLAEAGRHIARYKVPKAIVRVGEMERSPSGKADYRWARAQAVG